MIIVVLTGTGAYLAYENTLPTTVATNYKSGQLDVPTDGRITLDFSRPVAIAAVQAAFSISPPAAGTIAPVSGQNVFAWSPSKPLAELTAYTVTMKPVWRVRSSRWKW